MKPSQAVIIMLLVANLVATIWFGIKKETVREDSQIEQASQNELPPVLTSEVRDKLLDDFIKYFNAVDYDSLYNMIGPVAKNNMNKESVIKGLEQIVEYYHPIESGAYSHFLQTGTKGSTNIYTLYYSVKLSDKSISGSRGTLKITIAVQGNDYQIYGILIGPVSNA